jgi:hypothetical protein
MKLLFITNSIELASFAVHSGVDRIFVDLEINGKNERQGHLDTVISRHTLSDVAKLRPVIPSGQLLVRINPIHSGSDEEIDHVIRAGADTIMLPMFHSPKEVEEFTRIIAGRTRTCLLAETIGAMHSLHECIAVPGVDEVHIGLNDLHLELGNRFMFEPLANGLVDKMAVVLNRASIPFGLGGVARVGEGHLPAELILSEHARLGSTAAILSRSFHRQAKTVSEIREQMDFSAEILKLRCAYTNHRNSDSNLLYANQVELNTKIAQIVASIQSKEVV